MFVTRHAQQRMQERTGLFFLKRELGWLADKAKQVRNAPNKQRKCTVCGRTVIFRCSHDTVVTVVAA